MARATDDSANLGSATSATRPRRRQPQLPVQPLRRPRPDPVHQRQPGDRGRRALPRRRRRLHHRPALLRRRVVGAARRPPVDRGRHAARLGHLRRATRSSAGTRSRSRRPVRVTKDTTYVASFLSSDGTYYADPGFFNAAFDAAPLHAPRPAANGVYKYGGGFPTDSFDATSYGADVLFTPTDQTPPQVARSLPPAAPPASIRAPRSPSPSTRPSTPRPSDAGSFFLRNEAGALVPADVTYDAATPHRHAAAPVAAGLGDHVHRHGQGRRRRLRRPRRQPAGPGPHVVVHHRRAAARLQRPRRGRHQGLAVRAGSDAEPARVDLERREAPHRLAAHGPGVEERDGQAPRHVPRGHAQLPRPAQAPGRQAHRRDQDGDGGRRQDEDGHAQCSAAPPAAT